MSGPGRNQMNNGIFPAHLNAVATNHSTGLHKVTSIDELKDLVAKTYHMFRDKFAEEAHEHPSYQAYRLVYAVFKHDSSRLSRIRAIRILEVRATVFFTSKIHALNT
jgi:hypothetical protein